MASETDDEEELIDEIVAISDEIGRVPRQKDIRDRSDQSISRFRRVFGSWNGAVEAAGFKPYPKRRRIPDEELVAALDDLSEEVGGVPTAGEMTAYGEYSHAVYIDRFGSWAEALDEAGLEREETNAPTRENLLSELRQLAEELDDIPSSSDVDRHGEYSYSAYYREFESFTDALKEADLL